ncbi:retrovirus-related Pol polyprotein from transposon 17.6 [Caerostris darwini]|uniref:Retrovirus-related Pol polyprotein from transposon 17.6 n=1 Tax=Caerostris darwini TaxID=1538125 RepID=A0AAV4M953_9ARAC|nr:retrovirus-related Pol polyprotein from transposon 17.6 [Caerostris darwini]
MLPHCKWYKKKGNSDCRPISDFRALNTQTIKDKYPLPCILDFNSELHGCKIFSHVYLVKAFHQTPIGHMDIHKTAICTPFRLYESTRFHVSERDHAKIPEPFRDRVKVIQNFARPQTITQLRKFLGLYNFYRLFISKASHILAPLARFLEGFANKKNANVPPYSQNIRFSGMMKWT